MSTSHLRSGSRDPRPIGLQAADLPPLAASPEASRLDPASLFPPERAHLPFELEIGSGKGTFLVQQASQLPLVNYIGLEYAHAFWLYAADRCRRRDLDNVRLLNYDASVFVTWYTPDEVFRQVHIYFPDPWPKTRHHKRRLINADFLVQLHRILVPEGLIRIVTDHDGYFQWINDHLQAVSQLFTTVPFQAPVSADTGEIVGTNFERKYRRLGKPFHSLALQRS